MLVAVPGIGTNVATSLDEDDDDVGASTLFSQQSTKLGEKVTPFDVLGFDGSLASDQSTSSYIA